jgi:hypothetical protein
VPEIKRQWAEAHPEEAEEDVKVSLTKLTTSTRDRTPFVTDPDVQLLGADGEGRMMVDRDRVARGLSTAYGTDESFLGPGPGPAVFGAEARKFLWDDEEYIQEVLKIEAAGVSFEL